MPAILEFHSIKNGAIFKDPFNEMCTNNTIEFDRSVAVIYAPNGGGKSSLTRVLGGKEGTEVSFKYGGREHTKPDGIFHIINDQNSRNIIEGETQDFVLGDNIRRENELANKLAGAFDGKGGVIEKAVKCLSGHSITAAASPIILFAGLAGAGSGEFVSLVQDIANKQNRAKGRYEDFIHIVSSVVATDIYTRIEPEKLKFIEEQYSKKSPWISKLEELCGRLHPLPKVKQVEENTFAIDILERFQSDNCVVCDRPGIDREGLLREKKAHKESVIKELSPNEVAIVQGIAEILPTNDPLGIKDILYSALSDGDAAKITALCTQIEQCKIAIGMEIKAEFSELLTRSRIRDWNDEYQQLLQSDLKLTDEDELYIQDIIEGSMDKDLMVERFNGKQLRITLSGQPLLNEGRDNLHLSSGEQNFLSLAFEFLKARKTACAIIVLDDPISSLDSIYKNKTAFAILKFLERKNCIVLTHNNDLLRLLDVQISNCYNLYLMNNTDDQNFGFVKLSKDEKDIAIYIDKLLRLFRKDIFPSIANNERFLVSMIPFMRGYARIVDCEAIYQELCKVMHGYETGSVDLAAVYRQLFEKSDTPFPAAYPEHFEMSVAAILAAMPNNDPILNRDQFRLLDKTLRHSSMYLYLRLLTEKRLMSKIQRKPDEVLLLGDIIKKAFKDDASARAILSSKKTLMNEFNHFEGNLSIFMPAMDITDRMLEKEKDAIIDFLNRHCPEETDPEELPAV